MSDSTFQKGVVKTMLQHALSGEMRKFALVVACVLVGCVSAFAQGYLVQGTISGQTGKDAPTPLIGATVSIKNSTVGTTTDINGHYSISVKSSDDVLVFEFIGYKTEEVPVGSRTVVDCVLKDESQRLARLS